MRIKLEKMNRLKGLNLILLTLLALAAGAAKVAKTPEEIVFFQQFGFSDGVVVLFGVVQVLASVLLIFKLSRVYGLLILGLTFLSSFLMILFAGQVGFAIFSLLPLFMIIFAMRYPLAARVNSKISAEKV